MALHGAANLSWPDFSSPAFSSYSWSSSTSSSFFYFTVVKSGTQRRNWDESDFIGGAKNLTRLHSLFGIFKLFSVEKPCQINNTWVVYVHLFGWDGKWKRKLFFQILLGVRLYELGTHAEASGLRSASTFADFLLVFFVRKMPQRTKENTNKFASYLTNGWETASCLYCVWPGWPSVERLLKSSSLSTPSLGSMAGCDLSLTRCAPHDTHSTPTTWSASLPLTLSTCSLLLLSLFVPLLLLSLARLSTLACPLFKLTTQSFPCSALSFLPSRPLPFSLCPMRGNFHSQPLSRNRLPLWKHG